ncbi:MAG TPA: hypothetical protein VGA85_00860 [Dehalococcoidales bacterium]
MKKDKIRGVISGLICFILLYIPLVVFSFWTSPGLFWHHIYSKYIFILFIPPCISAIWGFSIAKRKRVLIIIFSIIAGLSLGFIWLVGRAAAGA